MTAFTTTRINHTRLRACQVGPCCSQAYPLDSYQMCIALFIKLVVHFIVIAGETGEAIRRLAAKWSGVNVPRHAAVFDDLPALDAGVVPTQVRITSCI